MDDTAFWSLVGVLNLSETELPPLTDADSEALLDPLRHALTALPAKDIEDFDQVLARKLHAIDTEAHMKAFAWGSLDGFLYARCWVVARGEDFYERVASDPSAMPRWLAAGLEESLSFEAITKIPPPELEPLLYVAAIAYEEKTGTDFPGKRSVSVETGSNRVGWPNRAW